MAADRLIAFFCDCTTLVGVPSARIRGGRFESKCPRCGRLWRGVRTDRGWQRSLARLEAAPRKRADEIRITAA